MVKELEDWERKTVGDCSLILQGGTPSTLIGKYWDGDVTWVTPSDISRLTGMWITNSERNLSPAGIAHSSAVILPEKTILLCTRASIGALALTTRPMATNQGFKNLVCKPGVDPVFLAYLLTTKTDEMKALSVGTTFLELSKKNLSEIPLRVPPHSEQRAIAEVLSGFDEHLANLDHLIVKKKAIRDGAVEELVTGRTRIADYRDPWVKMSFEETIQPKARIGWQGLKTEEYLSTGYSYLIGGTDFDSGTIGFEDISFVSRVRYEMDPYIQVRPGDVLVTKDGTIGKVARVPQMNRPATLNSGVFVFRPGEGLSREFLYWVLMSPVFERFIDTLAAGSTIKHLYQKDLKDFTFMAPPSLSEQTALAEILFGVSEEIRLLEEERAKVERLKFGVMDDLLTGRVRLPIEERAA